MNELRILLLALSFLLLAGCSSDLDDDDDTADDDDTVADDDDVANDDDSSVANDDDSTGSDDDDSATTVDDDDSATTVDDDDTSSDDDDAAPVTFACGASLTCTVDAEYCQIGYPGVPNSSPIYSCEDMPTPCAASPDCTCILGNMEWKPDSCSSGPLGGDTVEIYYP